MIRCVGDSWRSVALRRRATSICRVNQQIGVKLWKVNCSRLRLSFDRYAICPSVKTIDFCDRKSTTRNLIKIPVLFSFFFSIDVFGGIKFIAWEQNISIFPLTILNFVQFLFYLGNESISRPMVQWLIFCLKTVLCDAFASYCCNFVWCKKCTILFQILLLNLYFLWFPGTGQRAAHTQRRQRRLPLPKMWPPTIRPKPKRAWYSWVLPQDYMIKTIPYLLYLLTLN